MDLSLIHRELINLGYSVEGVSLNGEFVIIWHRGTLSQEEKEIIANKYDDLDIIFNVYVEPPEGV